MSLLARMYKAGQYTLTVISLSARINYAGQYILPEVMSMLSRMYKAGQWSFLLSDINFSKDVKTGQYKCTSSLCDITIIEGLQYGDKHLKVIRSHRLNRNDKVKPRSLDLDCCTIEYSSIHSQSYYKSYKFHILLVLHPSMFILSPYFFFPNIFLLLHKPIKPKDKATSTSSMAKFRNLNKFCDVKVTIT